jgi:hypothetical protein
LSLSEFSPYFIGPSPKVLVTIDLIWHTLCPNNFGCHKLVLDLIKVGMGPTNVVVIDCIKPCYGWMEANIVAVIDCLMPYSGWMDPNNCGCHGYF